MDTEFFLDFDAIKFHLVIDLNLDYNLLKFILIVFLMARNNHVVVFIIQTYFLNILEKYLKDGVD